MVAMKTPNENEIYTVSSFNQEVRQLLEGTFHTIWLTGEISNLAKPSSGHFYFSLKDEKAQVRCAMFRNSMRQLRFIPENGQHVIARAAVSLYEPRGDFQLIIQELQLSGEGLLQIAFEKLKTKLAALGLFDTEHKKPLPRFPKQIGVITSASGAAIHDILTVLKRRFPSIPVIIYPTLVQGELAAKQIVSAIQTANARQECDVFILARGGGSLEDLWPFNEELVAQAIFGSKTPIITGIGHEVDVTIADFVADFRAATPSAAAEQASPSRVEWQENISKLSKLIIRFIQLRLQKEEMNLSHLMKRLRHPGQRLREQAQRLDRLELNLILAYQNKIKNFQAKLNLKRQRLMHLSPAQKIKPHLERLELIKNSLQTSINNRIEYSRLSIQNSAHALDTLNPLRTLQRGYAIVMDAKDNKIISSTASISIGDSITTKFVDGKIVSEVKKKVNVEKDYCHF